MVKFPYLLYEPIIRGLLPIVFYCIEADTTVLVGALFILSYRVKCIPIYLVPLESTYSRRWCPGKQVHMISNSGVIHEKSLQPAAKTLHVFASNPFIRLPRVFEAYKILVFIDIRGNQDRTL